MSKWRRDLRRRRKEARLKKKELYITDPVFRSSQDAKKKKIFDTALSVGGSIAGLLPFGGTVAQAITGLRSNNELGSVGVAATREDRLVNDTLLRGDNPVTDEPDKEDEKRIYYYIGAAAVVLLFVLKK